MTEGIAGKVIVVTGAMVIPVSCAFVLHRGYGTQVALGNGRGIGVGDGAAEADDAELRRRLDRPACRAQEFLCTLG